MYSIKTVAGKKRRLRTRDFEQAFETCGVPTSVFAKLRKKYFRLLPKMLDVINNSFLPNEMKDEYKRLLEDRIGVGDD